MRVAYVAERPRQAGRTGGLVRREGLIRGLRAAGLDVVECLVDVPVTPGSLATRHLGLRDPQSLTAEFDDVDVWHVEGLPLAHVATAARRQGVPAVIDLCDSWLRQRRASVVRTRGVGHWLAARLAAESVMRLVVPRASAITYISEVDRTFDLRRVRPIPAAEVVPNGVDEGLFDLPVGRCAGEVIFIGDWEYPPNREALAWLMCRVLPVATLGDLRVHLYGPTPPSVILTSGVVYEGYAPDLAALYGRAKLVIAPVHSGAGVKNKVLEAIAAGLPVLTTREGVSGLSADVARHAYVEDDAVSFAATMMRLTVEEQDRHRLARGREAASHYTWNAAAKTLMGVYESAERRVRRSQARANGRLDRGCS